MAIRFTTAATLNNFRRIVLTCARASSVPANAVRRNACTSTYAAKLNSSRN